jgi:hypothetical protein
MRATSMRRLVGGATALMLIGTMLLTTAGSALAADTRFIYVGPDPAFAANNDTLAFTPVTAGGDSLSTIYVKNVDNQTLTHVVITIALTQGANTVSSQVLGPNASNCSPSSTAITCDFGNLKAKAARQSWRRTRKARTHPGQRAFGRRRHASRGRRSLPAAGRRTVSST